MRTELPPTRPRRISLAAKTVAGRPRLAYAQAGGIVFEPFFISNDTDLALFKTTKWGICRAIADAIASELGASKV